MLISRETICTVNIPEYDLNVIVKALEKIIDDERYTKLEVQPVVDALKHLR